jgi:hypothetical protein
MLKENCKHGKGRLKKLANPVRYVITLLLVVLLSSSLLFSQEREESKPDFEIKMLKVGMECRNIPSARHRKKHFRPQLYDGRNIL